MLVSTVAMTWSDELGICVTVYLIGSLKNHMVAVGGWATWTPPIRLPWLWNSFIPMLPNKVGGFIGVDINPFGDRCVRMKELVWIKRIWPWKSCRILLTWPFTGKLLSTFGWYMYHYFLDSTILGENAFSEFFWKTCPYTCYKELRSGQRELCTPLVRHSTPILYSPGQTLDTYSVPPWSDTRHLFCTPSGQTIDTYSTLG
jgi:hypothetical protein